jgi:hypothetical protein
MFGVRPEIAFKIFNLLEQCIESKHIHWTLYWLKNYTNEALSAIIFKVSEKHFREHIKSVVEKICNLPLISWDDRLTDWNRKVH